MKNKRGGGRRTDRREAGRTDVKSQPRPYIRRPAVSRDCLMSPCADTCSPFHPRRGGRMPTGNTQSQGQSSEDRTRKAAGEKVSLQTADSHVVTHSPRDRAGPAQKSTVTTRPPRSPWAGMNVKQPSSRQTLCPQGEEWENVRQECCPAPGTDSINGINCRSTRNRLC